MNKFQKRKLDFLSAIGKENELRQTTEEAVAKSKTDLELCPKGCGQPTINCLCEEFEKQKKNWKK